ncbi:hypothetical protein [Nonomuraea typhae]|uniref:Transcriptional regulator n=1 Tax=Nonomuraea typhae TaxID=2603600 RepID=A0ABW7YZJ1_9ACTN
MVPTRLRDILSIRWALRCTTPQASDTILGQGRAAGGYNAATLDPTQRGAGFLLAEGSMPVPMRAYFLGDNDVTTLTRRAYRLREAAGTLPASDARPGVRLLKALLTAFGERDRMWSTDLLAELTQQPGHTDWDPSRLSAQLRPLGSASSQLAIEGVNRNGYRRGDLLRAQETV